MSDPRSRIPSIDALLGSDAFAPLLARFARGRVVEAARAAVEDVRGAIAAAGEGAGDGVERPERYAALAERWLADDDTPSLRPVINATGVVLHTNLGRAPLADPAVRAMRGAAVYSNLEYDLERGGRGSRYEHCVDLLRQVTGAEDALVVNNAAAALVLALNTLARGRGVAVSRGELVEIGGGFRIPEMLERAGAELVEVGSTNRTRLADYVAAVESGGVAALLKVHRSNFRVTGFTEEASVAELAGLGAARDIPLVHDLGSGLLVEAELLGLPDEPRAAASLAAGADVVVVSGDKLLGGPQAGVVVGRGEVVRAMRANPLCRALRVDKVTLAGLEATLRLYRDPARALAEIPTLRMLAADPAALRAAAERVAASVAGAGVSAEVVASSGAVGGGTFPGVELAGWAVRVEVGGKADEVAAALRAGSPPVVGRIVDDALVFDVRTLLAGQEDVLAERLREVLAGRAPAPDPSADPH